MYTEKNKNANEAEGDLLDYIKTTNLDFFVIGNVFSNVPPESLRGKVRN